MFAVPIREANYKRKAHRVTLPMLVEVNGIPYRTRDWSIIGVGIEAFDTELKPDQLIPAQCVIPMPDASLSLKVELKFKNRRGNVAGFEFSNLSRPNKRVLRQYIEHAIEGKIGNVEDLVSVVTTPGVATPIEDAITLTELESEGLTRHFKAKSYVSLSVGVLFIALVVAVLFYNTVYRIHATGVVTGNIEKITANTQGVVKAIHVGANTFVDTGTPMFVIADPDVAISLKNVDRALHAVEEQIQAMKQQRASGNEVLLMTLKQKLYKKEFEYQNAQQLFYKRIISIKDYSFIENQYQQAVINYQRALEESKQDQSSVNQRIDVLEKEKSRLQSERDALAERQIQQNVSAPVGGRVFHVQRTVGSYVTPNDVMILIEKNSSPHVLLKLLSDDALKIRIGMDAKVFAPSTDTEYEAKVVAVGYASANSNATVTQEVSLNETLIRLEFINEDVRLPPNTRVKVWIKTF